LGLGIFLCIISIVTAVCCISFLFNNSVDQSVIYGRSPSEIVASADQVANAGGVLGAKLSEYLMVNTFGIGSLVLAVYVFLLGLAVMGLKKIYFFRLTARCLFTTAAISIIIGLISYSRSNLFHLGGAHGYYINSLLFDYTSLLGAYATSLLLAGLLVAVYLNPIKKFTCAMSSIIRRPQPSVHNSTPEVPENDGPSLDSLSHPDDSTVPATSDDEDIIPVDVVPAAIAEEDESASDDSITDPTDHSRFMPPVALDDLEDNSDELTGPSISAVAVVPDEEDEPELEQSERTEPSAPAEPEMVIVNRVKEAKHSDEANTPAPIRHGDHIGLDTPYDPRASHSNYEFPSLSLLIERDNNVVINEEEQAANKALIVNALRSYNIEIVRIEATIGPTVTLYEIVPSEGTRIAKIKSLEDDIAMSLSALGIRIIAPIPGKGTIGIEVPNRKQQIVSMRTLLSDKAFTNTKMKLPLALGATISNDLYMADLTKMPHLLVAGATGQGKSVGLNCIITSLLYSKHPDELKFVLIDPKMVEFSLYQRIANQYLAKLPDEARAVITDPQKVVATLNSLCTEMDQRYELLMKAGVRDMNDYNERFIQRRLSPEDGHRYMPYIVMIVDEFADLIMTAGKDVSAPIARIAQKARAVGMHMIIATQRPSTDVITGMIKANFPARIAFKVTQGVDSKTILDRPGAQRLVGRGDMLTLLNGTVERVQCALVDTVEVEAICEHIGDQPGFLEPYELPEPPVEGGTEASGDIGQINDEFKRCALFIASQSAASITMMQRRFEIGFNKAGRYMDQMQTLGIVGPANGAKPRQVLMTPDEVERLFSTM
ncbi:MAG: DNA translocase FtsK, partial [Muribaculaceae bacterium]|nr:DNA translocase FtsK [Muribaculaceae bacterium]